MKSKINAIHFVGIGGIGMSSLAQFLLNKDYIVSGSDISRSSLTKKLAREGCTIFTKHDSKNIDNQDLMEYRLDVQTFYLNSFFSKNNSFHCF